jgi:hypothetical protein
LYDTYNFLDRKRMCIEVSFHPPNVTVGCGSSLPSQLEHYKYVQYSELEYMFVYYLKVNIAAGGNFDKRFRSSRVIYCRTILYSLSTINIWRMLRLLGQASHGTVRYILYHPN